MNLDGLFVPLVTPFDDRDRVDVDALAGLGEEVLAAGADGIVALGTTGEPATLDAAERRAVIEACVQAAGGRRLIVGAGSSGTRASVDALAELAAWPQVGAALVTVPPFLRPSEAGVLAHFAALAASSPVPLVVYNIPYRTGCALSAGALREIAALPGVIGVKHAVGSLDTDTVRLLADPPPEFTVLAGDDIFAAALAALGAGGAILASAHLQTAELAAMLTAWRDGDATTGRAIARRVTPLIDALFREPNPAGLKAALHAAGRIPTAHVRAPLLPATPPTVAAVLAALQVDTAGHAAGADLKVG